MTSPPLTDREYAYFKIVGKGQSSVVSEKLALEPTNEVNEGDINPRTKKPNKYMVWRYESGLDDRSPLNEHIQKLLSELEPHKENLVELSENYDLYLQCVGYFHPFGHGIHLDSKIIEKASTLKLSVDMDFYYIGDHGHDLDYH